LGDGRTGGRHGNGNAVSLCVLGRVEILLGADGNGKIVHRRWCLASEVEALVEYSGYMVCFILVGLLVIRQLNGKCQEHIGVSMTSRFLPASCGLWGANRLCIKSHLCCRCFFLSLMFRL